MFRTVSKAGWPENQETKGLVSGYYWATSGVGYALGPIIGGFIFQTYGWEYLVTGCAFTVFAAVIFFFIVVVLQSSKD